jgi:hypothetical protein
VACFAAAVEPAAEINSAMPDFIIIGRGVKALSDVEKTVKVSRILILMVRPIRPTEMMTENRLLSSLGKT